MRWEPKGERGGGSQYIIIIIVINSFAVTNYETHTQLIMAFGAGLVSFFNRAWAENLLTVFGVYLHTNRGNNFIIN